MLATRHHLCSVSPCFARTTCKNRVVHVHAYQNVRSKFAAPDKIIQELRSQVAELDHLIPEKTWDDLVEQASNQEPFTEPEIAKTVGEGFAQKVTIYCTNNPTVRTMVPRMELVHHCASVELFEGFLKQKLGIAPQQEVELCWGLNSEPSAGAQYALQGPDDFPLPTVVGYADSWGVDDRSKFAAPDKILQELRGQVAELDHLIPEKTWDDLVEQASNQQPFTEPEIAKTVGEGFAQKVTIYRTSNPAARTMVPRMELVHHCASVALFEGFLKQKLGIAPQQKVELCWGLDSEPSAGEQYAVQGPDDFPLPTVVGYADSWGVDDSM